MYTVFESLLPDDCDAVVNNHMSNVLRNFFETFINVKPHFQLEQFYGSGIGKVSVWCVISLEAKNAIMRLLDYASFWGCQSVYNTHPQLTTSESTDGHKSSPRSIPSKLKHNADQGKLPGGTGTGTARMIPVGGWVAHGNRRVILMWEVGSVMHSYSPQWEHYLNLVSSFSTHVLRALVRFSYSSSFTTGTVC